jgi:hypothetical protein
MEHIQQHAEEIVQVATVAKDSAEKIMVTRVATETKVAKTDITEHMKAAKKTVQRVKGS